MQEEQEPLLRGAADVQPLASSQRQQFSDVMRLMDQTLLGYPAEMPRSWLEYQKPLADIARLSVEHQEQIQTLYALNPNTLNPLDPRLIRFKETRVLSKFDEAFDQLGRQHEVNDLRHFLEEDDLDLRRTRADYGLAKLKWFQGLRKEANESIDTHYKQAATRIQELSVKPSDIPRFELAKMKENYLRNKRQEAVDTFNAHLMETRPYMPFEEFRKTRLRTALGNEGHGLAALEFYEKSLDYGITSRGGVSKRDARRELVKILKDTAGIRQVENPTHLGNLMFRMFQPPVVANDDENLLFINNRTVCTGWGWGSLVGAALFVGGIGAYFINKVQSQNAQNALIKTTLPQIKKANTVIATTQNFIY